VTRQISSVGAFQAIQPDLLIFVARIADVTIGAIWIVFLLRGQPEEIVRLAYEYNARAFCLLENVAFINSVVFAAKETFVGRHKNSLAGWLLKPK
jgi:hypothetical protein